MSRAEFHQKLYEWYARNGRHDLPWRQTGDAYAIWVSEVMLQQTQVKTVLERFYYPFLERFPHLNALAEADLQEVLQLWQGLGYYSRTKNLHKAAQIMAERGLNTLPSTPEELIKLPGIGRNTAHAIAAFAFNQPVPLLEANVKRVVARIFALEQPNEQELWRQAEWLLDAQNPFDYNQAMMDIGAMLCTPKAPQCRLCPAASLCKGKKSPESYPQKKTKKAVPIRKQHLFLLKTQDSRYAVRPRETRFLHGLWEFPSTPAEAQELVIDEQQFSLENAEETGEISHAYSHFILHARVWSVQTNAVKLNGWQWKTAEEIAALPLSRTEKKVLGLILD